MVLLPHCQHVIQYFSSSHPILSAASYHFQTICLVTGLLDVSLTVAKGDKLMGLKMVGLLFQSMEDTISM